MILWAMLEVNVQISYILNDTDREDQPILAMTIRQAHSKALFQLEMGEKES